jgi:acyl-coenzyme A synthetase/AMP-(fatty) acid ligase/2-polyprenyl-3-methyl-5-hydroxy-6-metoxy-1,4-benzoquinol methylase
LKAGKYFVLLDPSFPSARIAAILKDSQSALVLSQQQTTSLATAISNHCERMTFESISPSASSENLQLPLAPTMVASILYTSGSTGQPKGVVWAHRNRLHQTMLYTNSYHFCEYDRFTLLGSAAATAVTNIFSALLNGALLLPFYTQKEGVARLRRWVVDQQISVCWFSSPLFRNLCETLTGEETFPNLRLIRLSSETVYKSDVDLYKKHFPPNCIFANGLATNETGVIRIYLIDHNTEITGSDVPVGYPVDDKEILLVDEAGKEVGFNQVGEIVVRSRYLCPGYWRGLDLTADKFKPDPQGGENRLYFTGDLGLMLSDGCVVHKGRKDFRVKIRGYGVELSEIEGALLGHLQIRQAAVVAWDRSSGEKYLAAYVVAQQGGALTINTLRDFLSPKLPDYMLPSTFVFLESLPLVNGKIDRKALPRPDEKRPKLNRPYVPARLEVEQRLVNIWEEVLEVRPIGIHDNFFDLGGESLLATLVVSRIRAAFNVDLPAHSLFETPTVGSLARSIETERQSLIAQNETKAVERANLESVLDDVEALSDEQARQLVDIQSKQGRSSDANLGSSRRFWESIALDYTTAFSDIPEVARYVEQTESKHLFSIVKTSPNMEVLDLGCGFGRWTAEFGKRCRRVVAVDFSAKMIERAREYTKERGLTNVDLHVLPIQQFSSSDRFDIILLSGVLVGIEEAQLLVTLANARQHLKPSGHIIVRAIVRIKERHTVSNKIPNDRGTVHYSLYRSSDEYVTAFSKIGMRLCYANDMAPMDFFGTLYRRLVTRSKRLTPVLRKILSLGLSAQLMINPVLLRHKSVYRSIRDRLYKRKTVLLIFQNPA